MTAKHRTAEYQRNARTVRDRVKVAHRNGDPVQCWRCRGPIHPGQPYDVGHLPGAEASALHELAAEHRRCNRSAGGRDGARITNRRHAPSIPTTTARSWTV